MSHPIRIEFPNALYHLTARCVVLNPVRAGVVSKPEKWIWSSYRASMGLAPAEPFLAVEGLLAQIEKQSPDRNCAVAQANATGAYLCQQIAEHFGVHFTTVGRIVRGDR